jgi:YHS domain-containing protein
VVRVLLNFLHVVLWLLLIRIVVRALARAFSGGRASTPPSRPRAGAEDLVLDPVCRTHVPRSRSLVARVAGREEHFCSPACRDKALAAFDRAS